METHNRPTPPAAAYNPEKRQVNDKTTKRARVRSGQGTVAYWKAKLFRNTYRDRDGNTVEIPEFYVRIRHDGITRRVRLPASDKDKAAEEALRLSERVSAEGWGVVTSGLARMPLSPSIEDFCAAYGKAVQAMESPPRPITVAQYLRHLRQICELAGVKTLRELSTPAIERARDKYRAKARADGRKDAQIQNSLGIIIRNASACFSADARAALARQGLNIEANPFQGIRRFQKIETVKALDRAIIERIMRELPLLRDGDPDAEAPNLKRFAKAYRKKHGDNQPRWMPIDYTKPHPEAFRAILLGIGLGLRANEIDKARWAWIKRNPDGRDVIEIAEEDDFRPKGGTMRVVPVDRTVLRALLESRDEVSPYIIGGQASPSVQKNGFGYRCREVLRVANDWLRIRGVESESVRGNPLHALRKEFGSVVATGFGLFAAQKLLGHSSPMVTAKYYAAQTNLPTLAHVRLGG